MKNRVINNPQIAVLGMNLTFILVLLVNCIGLFVLNIPADVYSKIPADLTSSEQLFAVILPLSLVGLSLVNIASFLYSTFIVRRRIGKKSFSVHLILVLIQTIFLFFIISLLNSLTLPER